MDPSQHPAKRSRLPPIIEEPSPKSEWMERKKLAIDREVHRMQDRLEQVKLELNEESERKAKERAEWFKEFLDPEILKNRYEQLLELKDALQLMAALPSLLRKGVFQPSSDDEILIVSAENQKAVADFCPLACKTVIKTAQTIAGLHALRLAPSIIQRMEQVAAGRMQESRRMVTRMKKGQEERKRLHTL